MTYRQIRFLRHELGLSAHELRRKFPEHRRMIAVAEWSFRPMQILSRLARRDRRMYEEVIACRNSLSDED